MTTRLIFPGELAKHVIFEGTKAMTKYVNSIPSKIKGK
jgi:hypothetical protein